MMGRLVVPATSEVETHGSQCYENGGDCLEIKAFSWGANLGWNATPDSASLHPGYSLWMGSFRPHRL
jgi:hypothetical protein